MHVPEPVPDSAYTIAGPYTGRPADERLVRCYPMEALCACGQIVRCESQGGRWKHTGRLPGEPVG